MNQPILKSPRKGGAKRASENFEKDRKKEPSDELVKIISEYGLPEAEKKPRKDDQAAKDVEI